MRSIKRITALFTAAVMVSAAAVPAYAETVKSSPLRNEGKTLRIACSNELISTYVNAVKDKMKSKIEIKYDINDYGTGYYEDLALKLSEKSDPIDIFVSEPDYIDKHIDLAASLDDLGITEKERKNMFAYTRDMCSDSKGVQRAAVYVNSPGAFVYDRKIAKKVFGTDDPDKIQKYVSSWDKLLETGEKLKKKGYYLLADVYEMYHTFDAKAKKPFVSSKGKIQIDSAREEWAKYARKLVQYGYTPDYAQWTDEWASSVGSGKVFGWFACDWFSNYVMTLDYESNATFAACMGPQGYFWGGSIIAVSKNSDNYEAAAELMRLLCVDGSVVLKDNGVANNSSKLKKATLSGFLLDGQNPAKIYRKSLKDVDWSKRKKDPYYPDLAYDYTEYMHSYIIGECTYNEALTKFQDHAKEKIKK